MANTSLGKVSTDAALEIAALQQHERRDWFPFILSLPALLVVFLIIGVPLVYSVVLSLHRINIHTYDDLLDRAHRQLTNLRRLGEL